MVTYDILAIQMNDRIFDDFALERTIKEQFGVVLEVESVIADRLPVSATTYATVFLSGKKQLFVYVSGKANLTLGDVRKIMSRMKVTPELFVPPKGFPHYFDEIGRDKFRAVFPGRNHISPEDLIYYRTLAPYNPALVQVSEIQEGFIFQYDADARGSWRPSVKFAYRRIKTS